MIKDAKSRIFDSNTVSNANKYFAGIVPIKKSNETEDEYGERMNVFYRGSVLYFKGYAVKKINNILNDIAKNRIYDNNNGREYMVNIRIDDYNAQEGGCIVNCYMIEDCTDNNPHVYELGKGLMPISSQEANFLQQMGFSFIIEPIIHIGIENKRLYPPQISIVSKINPEKKYAVFFNRADTREIVFNGSELWFENPNLATLSFAYKDLIEEILEQRKTIRIAKEKRLQEEKRATEIVKAAEEKLMANEKKCAEIVKEAEANVRARLKQRDSDFLAAFLPSTQSQPEKTEQSAPPSDIITDETDIKSQLYAAELKGKAAGKAEVAKELKLDGMTVQKISKLTGLCVELIEKL
ncbi:MAG: hypothetical protein FWE23_08110 [Chitinivibrionia bacterium]|nr:hypothetical protein [Chitinivibrionia bacterium]